MAVNIFTFIIPIFEMVKVPPDMSSGVSLPSFAFAAMAFVSFAISNTFLVSVCFITGTTSPLSSATAIPTLTSANCLISLFTKCELNNSKLLSDFETA